MNERSIDRETLAWLLARATERPRQRGRRRRGQRRAGPGEEAEEARGEQAAAARARAAQEKERRRGKKASDGASVFPLTLCSINDVLLIVAHINFFSFIFLLFFSFIFSFIFFCFFVCNESKNMLSGVLISNG